VPNPRPSPDGSKIRDQKPQIRTRQLNHKSQITNFKLSEVEAHKSQIIPRQQAKSQKPKAKSSARVSQQNAQAKSQILS
jgi:hypothetical protein